MTQIVLIGFMGAGKTTVGSLLSEKLTAEFLDFDDMLVAEMGMSIQAYFDTYGEASFRKKETEVLQRAMARQAIISTGGGIVVKETNRELLKQLPYVVYLQTAPEEFVRRLQADHVHVRPLVVSKGPEEIVKLYTPREPLYEETAKIIIETTNKTPEEIVQEIIEQVGI